MGNFLQHRRSLRDQAFAAAVSMRPNIRGANRSAAGAFISGRTDAERHAGYGPSQRSGYFLPLPGDIDFLWKMVQSRLSCRAASPPLTFANLLCCLPHWGQQMQLDGLNRREFVAVLGAVMASWPTPARAQQRFRIGLLDTGLGAAFFVPFMRKLTELGYVEGGNLVLERKSAEGNVERLDDLAAELVRGQVDLIVTAGTPAGFAAKKANQHDPDCSWGQ
jgi:hypothetical protein